MKNNSDKSRFIRWVNGESEHPRGNISSMDIRPAVGEPLPPRKENQEPLHHMRAYALVYRVATVVVALSLMLALTYTVLDLPSHTNPNLPTDNEVSQRYLEKGMQETGAVNTVAGMILDYRAFDTFGEATVLFAATAAVLFITHSKHSKEWTAKGPFAKANPDPILQLVGKLLFPFIMVYGVYVVVNGHISPGGGFAGGAIMGGGLILASALFGQNQLTRIFSTERTSKMSVICLLTYAAMKGYSFFTGANHVGWEIPKGTPGNIFSAGFILPLNICVGIIVACTMYSFYSLFAQGEEE